MVSFLAALNSVYSTQLLAEAFSLFLDRVKHVITVDICSDNESHIETYPLMIIVHVRKIAWVKLLSIDWYELHILLYLY